MNKKLLLIAISGACANFACLGIARYAYTPMIPVLVKYKWLTLSQANLFATVLFVGYLLSVLLAKYFFHKSQKQKVIKACMGVLIICLIAASFQFGAYWLGFWLFVMGIQTGIIFLYAPGLILSTVSDQEKGLIAGIMFMGIGVGVVASSLITFFVIEISVQAIWIAMALCIVVALIIGWKWMPVENKSESDCKPECIEKCHKKFPLKLTSCFFLFRLGNLALTAYLGEYIVHTYATPHKIKISISWCLVGIAFLIGPFIFGSLSKYIGPKKSLTLALFLLASGTVLLTFNLPIWLLYLLAFIGGLGITSSAAMFSCLNSLESHAEMVYKNWKYILISGALSLFLGSIIFKLIIVNTNFHILFLIAGIIIYFSILVLLKPTKKITKV